MKKENEKNKKLVDELVERRSEKMRIHRDSKYGQFIIQTNEVQRYLTVLILKRTVLCSKKFFNYLDSSTFGNLVNSFMICVQDSTELTLVNDLGLYVSKRNALAHKMYTNNRLTEIECEASLRLGEELLAKLKELIRR